MTDVPKKIYYCWFGGEKPQSVSDCINNWKEKLPNYEIIEINEKNKQLFDVEKECRNNLWFKTVYENKLWAFVSDYARLKVLYENGGVYFDTDITVEKNITELLEKEKLVLGWENPVAINIAVGVVVVVVVGDPLIKQMLDFYNDEIWKSKLYTIPQIVTHVLRKNYDLNPANQITENDDILILPQEYFYPIPIGLKIKTSEKSLFVTPNTYTIHWWDGAWDNPNVKYFMLHKHKTDLNKLLKYCFEKKVILNNLFLHIEKICMLYKININFYWLFRFKYKSDYKNNRWLVLFLFGIPVRIWKMYGGH